MNWTTMISLGAIVSGLAVALGAFGAHALKSIFDERHREIFETAVRYQMYHGFALIVVGLVATRLDSATLRGAAWAFLLGAVLFSGSLYGYVASDQKSWALVTPIGGALFVVGWCLLAWSTFSASI